MILAYPYFRRGDIFYYVNKKVKNKLSILVYDSKSEEFLAVYHREIKQNKVTLDYRPKRITVLMSELVPVEE